MAKSRDLAKERYWRGVVRRFESSGLGARRFCAGRALRTASVLVAANITTASSKRRPTAREIGSGKADHDSGDQQRESSFLPVAFPLSVGGPIEVVHPRGHLIRVPTIFDKAALGNILAVIDASAGTSGEQ